MAENVPHQHPNTAFQQAVAHHREGRLIEAESFYRSVLQAIPNHPDANYNLGILALQSGHAKLGLPYLRAALEANPTRYRHWLSYAQVLYAVGQSQEAIAILEQSKQRGLSSSAIDELLTQWGAAHLPSSESENTSHLYSRAIRNHQAGELAEAIVLYREILVREPNFAEVHAHLGNALKTQGAVDEAVHCYRNALSLQPGFTEVYVNLGNALSVQGKPDEALASYRKALAARPDFAEAHFNLANVLKEQGALGEALASYKIAITLKPEFAEAHYNLGNAFKAMGAVDDALAAYANALAARPNFAEVHNNTGILLLELGQTEEAITSYRAALAIRPDYAEAHNNLGNALRTDGKLREAEVCCRKSLEIQPGYAEAHNSLGSVLYDWKKLGEAEISFRRSIAIQPTCAEAHSNLGNVLSAEGKFEEAVESYRRAIALKPDYIQAYNHLGAVLCESHHIAEGFEWFTQGSERAFRFSDGGPKKPAAVAPHKARHDREQRAYLACDAALDDPSVSERFHLEHGARVEGSAINLRNNIGEIEEQWQTKRPQIVVIDNLLTQPALEKLRRFCWSSTIWRNAFDNGYLGAQPESGFACPLLAQVAEELRISYPGIFHNHPLLYSWAFKYDNKLRGVQIHADFAAVNVNFWITPDEANLDPESGGLVVWDVAAPLDWDFAKYNVDQVAIHDFLAREKARSLRIPYRANRAVIFDSDLFHATDQMTFKDGYINRRMNITLLYGRRGDGKYA